MREFLRNRDFKQISYMFVALRISSSSAARSSNASGMLCGISQAGSGKPWVYPALGVHRIVPSVPPSRKKQKIQKNSENAEKIPVSQQETLGTALKA